MTCIISNHLFLSLQQASCIKTLTPQSSNVRFALVLAQERFHSLATILRFSVKVSAGSFLAMSLISRRRILPDAVLGITSILCRGRSEEEVRENVSIREPMLDYEGDTSPLTM